MLSHTYSDVIAKKRSVNPRGKPRNAEKTLASIMDTAEELFAKRGYEGTSLRLVAQQVEMSQPNFYNYFSSKEKLYESVLARSLAPMLTIITESIYGALSDKTENLRTEVAHHVIDIFVEQLNQNRNLAGLMYQELINGGAALRKLSGGMFESMLQRSVAGLEESNINGWPVEQLPFLVAGWFNLIFGYFASANLMQVVVPGSHDPLSQQHIETLKQFLKNVWDKLMQYD